MGRARQRDSNRGGSWGGLGTSRWGGVLASRIVWQGIQHAWQTSSLDVAHQAGEAQVGSVAGVPARRRQVARPEIKRSRTPALLQHVATFAIELFPTQSHHTRRSSPAPAMTLHGALCSAPAGRCFLTGLPCHGSVPQILAVSPAVEPQECNRTHRPTALARACMRAACDACK